MFIGYIDDSGNPQAELFTLSCIASHQSMWGWFRLAWEYLLEKKNNQLKSDKRHELSRYHANPCNARKGEFTDWSSEEQIEFTKAIIHIFRRHNFTIFACTVNVQDLINEFPESKSKPFDFASAIILLYLMNLLSEKILGDKRWPKDLMRLVHDRGAYDRVLRNAFEFGKHDERIKHRDRFTSIESKSSLEEMLLQAADFIAYENYKLAWTQLKQTPIRPSFAAVLDLDSFGGRGVNLIPSELKIMRKSLSNVKLAELLKVAGITKYHPAMERS
jgi:hypothetical protein